MDTNSSVSETVLDRSPLSVTEKQFTCGIYTRQSVDRNDGKDAEFDSRSAQLEACLAYVKSQHSLGWMHSSARYDDGGFSGANMNRPGLQKLLEDIAAKKIHCVLVYKVDRLGRSLRDFLELMAFFEQHGVMFVSVTQAFNTATSMGRLILNVLLSFAQFEREMISERTRDKMAAARRKGLWLGGFSVLGYDVGDSRLVINESEATIVREIFQLYLQLGGLLPVVHELERRGWRNKLSTAKDGRQIGGRPFTKNSLHRLLKNVTYIGSAQYRDEVHPGKHEPIVDLDIWQRTQDMLEKNGRTGGVGVRNKFSALLKGVLRCTACDCAMSPTHSTKSQSKRYRYYRCLNAQQRGREACPFPSLAAEKVESAVMAQVRRMSADPTFLAAALQQLDIRPGTSNPKAATAVPDFDCLWGSLSSLNQVRLVQQIVQRVDFDGAAGKILVTFQHAGGT